LDRINCIYNNDEWRDTGEELKQALHEIEGILTELFETQNWRPMFMIDDGTTEKYALSRIGHKFIIFKFHLIRARAKRLRELGTM
jgi:hypothetical protein